MTPVLGFVRAAFTRTALTWTAPVRPETASAPSQTGERYACPMMDFIGTRPGDCPVCGMRMTKVTAGELTAEQQRRMGIELAKATEGPATATVRFRSALRTPGATQSAAEHCSAVAQLPCSMTTVRPSG